MAKNSDSNGMEKTLLLFLSLISVGLLVAIVFVWYSALNKNNKPATKPGDFIQPESQTASSSIMPSESSSSSQIQQTSWLILSSPKNEDVVSTKMIIVSGMAKPNASITITGGQEDLIDTADAAGAFSFEVKLKEGQNDLEVTAFDSSGNKSSQIVSVVYMPL